jgi:predicted metal-dependent hydrolase
VLIHFTTKMHAKILKKSDKVIHVHAMKACWGSRCVASHGGEGSTLFNDIFVNCNWVDTRWQ